FLYGDPLGWRHLLLAYPHEAAGRSLASSYFWTIREGRFPLEVFMSFWGKFGWMTVKLSPATYGALAALTVGGALGALKAVVHPGPRERHSRPLLALLMLHVAGAVVLLLRYNITGTPQPQGRYLFPALGPLMILLAAGIRSWSSRRAGRRGPSRRLVWALVGSVLALLLVANGNAFLALTRAYAR
ncbi:MAG: hypothetical protein AAB368_17420, partial [bacterium]